MVDITFESLEKISRHKYDISFVLKSQINEELKQSSVENEKELFNLRHASLRNVIERIFGIFKSRFTIFKSAPPFLFKTQAELVLACAALHNFLRKQCRSDEFPVEPTDESSSSSSVLPNYEDNDHEPIVQTQEQEREDANIWRTNIGSDMWRNANN